MNFLCPACRTPLPVTPTLSVVPCSGCGVEVDLTRMDTAPGSAKLWPDVDLSGEALDGYRLKGRIGAGGMGAVYEAEGPEGRCAVKVLSALLAAEPGLRARFRREAAALRAITHPGVVRVLEDGEERGFCWYAMELVTGSDLRSRLARSRLPALEVIDLARRLLLALQAVHAAGLVHRDVKPGNILLAPEGPKLCDFGIARFDGSTTLTESAALMGSLRYMSPEQRLGRADARSDLYALGVVLHECLAGGVPGEAELPAKVPSRLRRLVEALLADRPDHRPPTAAATLALLDKKRGRAAIAAAAVGLIAATIGAVMLGPGLLGGGGRPAAQDHQVGKAAATSKMAAPAQAVEKAIAPEAPQAQAAGGNSGPAIEDRQGKSSLQVIRGSESLGAGQVAGVPNALGSGVLGTSTKPSTATPPKKKRTSKTWDYPEITSGDITLGKGTQLRK